MPPEIKRVTTSSQQPITERQMLAPALKAMRQFENLHRPTAILLIHNEDGSFHYKVRMSVKKGPEWFRVEYYHCPESVKGISGWRVSDEEKSLEEKIAAAKSRCGRAFLGKLDALLDAQKAWAVDDGDVGTRLEPRLELNQAFLELLLEYVGEEDDEEEDPRDDTRFGTEGSQDDDE